MYVFKTVFLFSLMVGAFSAFSQDDSRSEVRTDKEIELDRDRFNWDKEESKRKSREAKERSKREAQIKQIQDEMEARKEAARAKKEQLKEKEEKCNQADKDVQEELKDKKSEANEWGEKFQDKQQEIVDLEEELSKKQMELREKQDELKRNLNANTQELKDDMGQEIKGLENEVAQLEEQIAELNTQLEKIEDTRLAATYARRKQQNEFYSMCFTEALNKAEKARTAFYEKKQARRVRRKSMGELITGGKQQNKSVFSAKFNSILNLCLNNEAALLGKQNMKDTHKMESELMTRQEERAKKKIEGIKAQIQKMQTKDKAEILAKFKEKMETVLNNFNQDYDTLSNNYQVSAQQVFQQTGQIKTVQATYLKRRAEAVPQKTRSTLILQQCEQQNTLNLFPNPDSGSGIFNSSRSRAIYANPDSSGIQ